MSVNNDFMYTMENLQLKGKHIRCGYGWVLLLVWPLEVVYSTSPIPNFSGWHPCVCYVMLCYVMLCYVMLCHVMSCHVMSCYVICYMLYVICYVMLCYVMLCYVMLCYVMLCYVMLCYVMLCYVMLCYLMLCYAMLCYAMLCYAMLCYIYIFLHLGKLVQLEPAMVATRNADWDFRCQNSDFTNSN